MRMGGVEGLQALITGFKAAELCVVARFDGVIVSMFGYHGEDIDDSVQRTIWMLGSELMTTKPTVVVKLGKLFTREALNGADLVGNWVDALNKTHIHWLVRIGYRPTVETEVGPNKYKFYWFQKTSKE